MNEDDRLLDEIENALVGQGSDDDLIKALVEARTQARREFQQDLKARLIGQIGVKPLQPSPALAKKVSSAGLLQVARSGVSFFVIGLVVLITVVIFSWFRQEDSNQAAPSITLSPSSTPTTTLSPTSAPTILAPSSTPTTLASTSAPTTLAPNGTPASPPTTLMPTSTSTTYYIAYFTSDSSVIQPGNCATLSYWVVGAQSITLQASDQPGNTIVIDDNPNQRQVCLAAGTAPGATITYTLNVTYIDGSTDQRSITLSAQ